MRPTRRRTNEEPRFDRGETPVTPKRRAPIRRPVVRLGVDFGTSTIQVAVRTGTGDPRLVPLEDATEHLPSYFGFDADGLPAFGARAQNLPVNVHSLKPLLAEDAPIAAVRGLRPSDIAHLMLSEVVARTLARLKSERVLPGNAERLEVATKLGCTPTFSLATRSRLRDVARCAGLQVDMVDLVEEPVAAAFELMFAGLVPDGRLLVVDVGGGTLDVGVMRTELGTNRFDLYATRGSEHAGDRLTEVIVKRAREEISERLGQEYMPTYADETLIWQRAESAKLALSALENVVLPLGGIGSIERDDIELTRDWYDGVCRKLRPFIQEDIRVTYLLARLVLDRGGRDDPHPGTIDFGGGRLPDLRVNDGLTRDVREHIDHVVVVGGGANSPFIRAIVEEMFPGRVVDTQMVGLDPVSVVALGLARGERLTESNLRFPNWGIGATFRTPADPVYAALYEPFAPAFKVDGGRTSEYEMEVRIPPGSQDVTLEFQPIGGPGGQRSGRIPLKASATRLGICLTLFGDLDVTIKNEGGLDECHAIDVPWRPQEGTGYAEWLVRKRNERATAVTWDWPDDVPG